MEVLYCDVCEGVIKNHVPRTRIIRSGGSLIFSERWQNTEDSLIDNKEEEPIRFGAAMDLCHECKESFLKTCQEWEEGRKKETESLRWR